MDGQRGRTWLAGALAAGALLAAAALLLGGASLVSMRLGVGPAATLAVLSASLFASRIDVPVARVRGGPSEPVWEMRVVWDRILVRPVMEARETIVAVNVGGAVIPVLVSAALLVRSGAWWQTGAATAAVAAVAYTASRVVPGVGVVMPLWAAPVAAAVAAVTLAPGESAAVAYASAALGTLIGADLLHLRHIGGGGMTVASIGGAGTFDGIFLGALAAVGLAAL